MRSVACALCIVMVGLPLCLSEKGSSGNLLSKHRRSMKTLPREGDMPADSLHRFYAGIEELQDTRRRLSSVNGVSFAYQNIAAELRTDSSNMPEELKGIWLMADHPTFGDTLVTMHAGTQKFQGSFGENLPHENSENVWTESDPNFVCDNNNFVGVGYSLNQCKDECLRTDQCQAVFGAFAQASDPLPGADGSCWVVSGQPCVKMPHPTAYRVYELRTTNQPGYTYASVKASRTLAVAKNNQKALRALKWFHEHGLEFSFPDFGSQSLKAGDTSWINTHMDGDYEKYPVPGAILEGWDGNVAEYASWKLGTKIETDPAKCFCSVIYKGNGVLDRNNFGEFGYKMYQVVNGLGDKTEHWNLLSARMAAKGITEFFTIDPNGHDVIDVDNVVDLYENGKDWAEDVWDATENAADIAVDQAQEVAEDAWDAVENFVGSVFR